MNPYWTIETTGIVENNIQKSRFIGQCFPVSEEREAAALLDKVRHQYWDATHNCYAYCIGERRDMVRSSDDGEPSGTAGMPILQTLGAMQVTNVLCIVTRYFGGILLGAGGLVRAYSGAASAAVHAAGIVQMQPCTDFDLTLSYSQWAAFEKQIRTVAAIGCVDYTDKVHVHGYFPENEQQRFDGFIRNLLDGSTAPDYGMTLFRSTKAEENVH